MRRCMARAATLTLAIVGGIAMTAGQAAADPTNAKKGEILEVQCDGGLGTLTVALNGNTELTPGLVTTSNQVVVPYRLHIEGSFTPTGGDPEPIVVDVQKPGPHNGRLATCTFHEGGSNEFGSLVLDGTIWVSYTATSR
jgi:hypothetical protein